MYKLLCPYWRIHTDAKQSGVMPDQKKKQNKITVISTFLIKADLAGVTTQEDTELTAVNILKLTSIMTVMTMLT